MKNLNKIYIHPITGIAIVCSSLTIMVGLVVGGASIGSEYESSCVAKAGEEPVCTTRYAYKGLGNLDVSLPSLQVVATAIAFGFTAYSAFKKGQVPTEVKQFFSANDDNLPGSS